MLGERLKEARKAAGLSQSAVAKAVGVSQPAYHYIESGENNPSLPLAKKIATKLNISLDNLVESND